MAQIEAMQNAKAEFEQGRLQIRSVKFWADGILESYTAQLIEPYSDKPDTSGMLMVSREQMLAGVPAMDALGFQVHIHAIGDGTVRYALDAFEKAQQENSVRDSRHLPAHTQLVDPQDLPRFAQLNAIAGFSPYWANADEYVDLINRPQLGEARMKTMYPMQSLLDSGATKAFGSDWYVSTADPLLGIETAITRQEPHASSTEVFLPEQRISLDAAIAGYTINAAYANFLDADTGSVEVGKYADLVIIQDNLFDLPVAQISDTKVTATLLEGEIVYGNFDQ